MVYTLRQQRISIIKNIFIKNISLDKVIRVYGRRMGIRLIMRMYKEYKIIKLTKLLNGE